MRTRVLLCGLAALVLAPAADARGVARPPVTWLKGEGNYTKAHRALHSIDRLVVHVTEGPFWGSIEWLRSQRSHASAHYIVSRRGRIVQMVHQSDIAWHAGNWRVNAESVGIEHEGVTDSPAGFTAAQYRSSARLAAYIARRALMPIDRNHLIGHAEVPDPTKPGAIGGSDNHTDPGRYWDWRRYVRLVRRYAYPPKPKPRPKLRIASVGVKAGGVVRGKVAWRAVAGGPGITRVDFLVDGKLRWRDRTAPYAFARARGWDTRGLANGRHRLEVRVFGRRGAWTRQRLQVVVRNPAALRLALAGPADGAVVQGVVPVAATVRGGRPRVVELYLDGKRIDHDRSRPYAFAWDSRRAPNGRHTLTVLVRAPGRPDARKTVRVAVANGPEVLDVVPAEGAVVAGPVALGADVRGPVARVEFLLDGDPIGSAAAAPWRLEWNPTGVAPGPHVLTVRAHSADGLTHERNRSILVSPTGEGSP